VRFKVRDEANVVKAAKRSDIADGAEDSTLLPVYKVHAVLLGGIWIVQSGGSTTERGDCRGAVPATSIVVESINLLSCPRRLVIITAVEVLLVEVSASVVSFCSIRAGTHSLVFSRLKAFLACHS
jgi:hypothetical protein